MNYYLLITSRTPNFNPDILPAHFAYLNKLKAAGRVELSGGFSDASGGAYIVRAETFEEAQRIAAGDPLAESGSSTIAVNEWLVNK
ncbi:YciI family protein [Aneurinibacillus sp. Ricciae_BoGa-3]|uniref:YciI family protein n=1 Tax=Aneurinibacillus sp. Ricciae_BoGa-3 TaxID=3022697 RepID=UPI002342669F|nr:YciI family protein [Aneurinibacillus sp. Ricciae_BoGa-3]WCK56612.1 YciI family protein [Aneurinibacillus sp. Ricciae_BoGa-3]